MEGTFGFETLSRQEAQEKKSARLTKLEASFFSELRRYLEILEVSHRQEQEKNPGGKKVQFLADELRNAKRKSEALWEARERKIVFQALKNARGDPTTPAPAENLTKEEQPFYDGLVRGFREQARVMLPSMLLEAAAAPRPLVLAAPPTASAVPTGATVVATPPTRAETPAPAPPAPAANAPDEFQTVRALVDIPPFVGYDGKTYRIKKGEVLSLPPRFARILKDRGQIALVG